MLHYGIKKNKNASLEDKRYSLLGVGLLFVGSLVLASFSYTKKIEHGINRHTTENVTQIDYLQIEEKIVTPQC